MENIEKNIKRFSLSNDVDENLYLKVFWVTPFFWFVISCLMHVCCSK